MLGKCQKAKSRKHSCLQWDYSEPWRIWLSIRVGEGQHRRREHRRLGLLMRELNSWRHIRTPVQNRTPDLTPSLKNNNLHLLHEPPHNLERLKFKVAFPVTEIRPNTQSKQWSNSNGQSGMLVRDWNPKIKQMSGSGSGKQSSHGSQKSL